MKKNVKEQPGYSVGFILFFLLHFKISSHLLGY